MELLHEPLPRFLVQAVVIIAAARLIGILARRANQPLVIAEIVAGIVLGPSLLGWLAPNAMTTLFPAESMPVLAITSQIGLVFFMFLIGLELDPKLLRGRGRASVVISHTSIVVPFALGAALAIYLYPRLADPGVPHTSFMLFMGVAMSITAFPVLARILAERRLLRTHIGAVTIACAAVDDVTAWCVLAFVVSITRATGMADAALTAGYALIYIAAMLFVVRPFLGKFGARAPGPDGVTQNVVAVAFVLLLVSATITEAIGIHALFGAFMLGAIIPRVGGFAHALAERLEDLVVVFLLPLFFAYSGLRTHVGLLDTADAWITCAGIILVACLGKFGGSAIAARLTGLRWREATALGILMNTRGLMELIVLNIGLDLGVISTRLFTMMVIMALVTTFVTSPLLAWVYPDAEMIGDAVASAADRRPQVLPATPPYGMLMCVADPRTGPAMVQLVRSLVGERGTDVRLFALHLQRPPERPSDHVGEIGPSGGLDALLDQAGAVGLSVRPLEFVSNKIAADICNVAEVKAVDLVVLGGHRPLLGQRLLSGPVSDVMQQCPVDVAVWFDRGFGECRRVLVPWVGTGHDRAALELARRLMAHRELEVTLLHVVQPDAVGGPRPGRPDAEAAEVFEGGPGEHGKVRLELVGSTQPSETVLAHAARGYDLVIIGADPVFGLEQRMFALAAERVIRDCPTSLLVVRRGPRRRTPDQPAPHDPADDTPSVRRTSGEG
ncbi:MAG: cation:proton antiporter [Deltaproteobacteria bacterium]|nr:cation:proton antiporter [Deltaproteobacteria bacterium]